MTENEALKIIGEVPVSLNYAGSLVEIKKAYDVIQKAIEEIQEYREIGTVEESKALKDTGEQGLIVKLPFAIGSDVYYIPSKANFGLNVLHHHEEFNRVYHQKIARIHFTENGWYAEGNLNLEYGVVDRLFVDKSYKETWFLTQEEAEQALTDMKGGAE